MAEGNQTKLTDLHVNADKGTAGFAFSIWRERRPGTIYGEFPIVTGGQRSTLAIELAARKQLKEILLAAGAVL